MKPVNARTLCRAAEKKGWILYRTTGGHYIYGKGVSDPKIVIPYHGSKDLSTGVQRNIMRDAGLTDADL